MSIELTPPKGSPLPPTPPLPVELAPAALTDVDLETAETSVTRSGDGPRDTVLVIVATAWEVEVEDWVEVDVDEGVVLVDVELGSVDVVEEGVVEVEVDVEVGATLDEEGATEDEEGSSTCSEVLEGVTTGVVGAAADEVGAAAEVAAGQYSLQYSAV
jgi:hypothetical protein